MAYYTMLYGDYYAAEHLCNFLLPPPVFPKNGDAVVYASQVRDISDINTSTLVWGAVICIGISVIGAVILGIHRLMTRRNRAREVAAAPVTFQLPPGLHDFPLMVSLYRPDQPKPSLVHSGRVECYRQSDLSGAVMAGQPRPIPRDGSFLFVIEVQVDDGWYVVGHREYSGQLAHVVDRLTTRFTGVKFLLLQPDLDEDRSASGSTIQYARLYPSIDMIDRSS